MAKMTEHPQELLTAYSGRMLAELDWLATFGGDAEGGVTRLLYSAPWLQAQMALMDKMQELGLTADFDEVGNLFGKLKGSEPELKPVLTGSHVDTVKNGGKYDGAYGVVASMMALGFLKAVYGTPKRTLEVVSFCEEEGSRFPLAYWGSGHVTGALSMLDGNGLVDREGVTMLEAMAEAGFETEPARLYPARREDIGAYIEIHIEQGGVLEYKQKQIGVVTAIVGQIRHIVVVSGASNHAGTTPMTMRRDALAGAAEMVALTERKALGEGEPLVATVGRLEVKRGTSNVVPGEVEFTLDIRHTDAVAMDAFRDGLLAEFREIAKQRGLSIQITEHLYALPVAMDEGISAEIEAACDYYGYPSWRMPSGAGHDAQLFGTVCPSAMIFVPSQGGISHSPKEYTSPEELVNGFQTLVRVLYQYGYGGKADEDV
ncbi:Zn-dependent hydrolase [Paenibacillus ferrarius]|uniref:Zn-dependent hydrolase n=1 Tax=Paenibacillus ferrarius TaxID=1469647 RepID=UPI003D26DB8A